MADYTYEDATRLGIAVVTDAYLTPGPFEHVSSAALNDYLDDDVDPALLFVGVLNVAGRLLERIHELTGNAPDDELQLLAARLNDTTDS